VSDPCPGDLEVYLRIPENFPELQSLFIGVLVGVVLGWASFLFWWFFWKNHT
jgi:hypothetical protein